MLFWVFAIQPLAAKDHNILAFGAVADGTTLNTTAIQKAIDAAHANGGGRVIIPQGKFLSGTIELRTGVELHLEKGAVLLGSTNVKHYRKINRWMALVMADHADNIAITGQGTLDGQGAALALSIDSLFYIGEIDSSRYKFPEMRPKAQLRPQVIELVDCRNVRVTGVTVKDAACWVQTFERCQNLVIDSIRVESDAYWNNDGIDISDCRNVRITNCYVNSADDGICLKSHSKDASFICDSIYIANCTVRSSASAVKFGSASFGGFRNVVIENIKVFDTFRSAIAIESVHGGVLEDILVQNIEATNTGNAIFIRIGKRWRNRPAGQLRNVVIRNIRVEVPFERMDYGYEIRGPELPFFHNVFPASITGLPGIPVQNVTLENIEITYPGRGNKAYAYLPLSRLDAIPELPEAYPEFSMFGELPAWGLYARHVEGLTLKGLKLRIKAPDYRPVMVFDDVKGLTVKGLEVKGDNKPNPIVLHNSAGAVIE
ncbi:MAG: glycoside hydrolase family 28 protein [Bacteroidota bacterium]